MMFQIKQDVRFFLRQLQKNLRNEQALRGSFLLQVAGMFMSNVSFFIIWVMFSHTIGPVNGWGPLQTFGMLSISIFIYGIVHSLFGSVGRWYELVPTGAFDVFLNKPKGLYLRLISFKFSVSALGDLIQGVLGIVLFIYMSDTSLAKVGLLLLLLIPALVIHIAMMTMCACLVFWLPQAPSLCQALFNIVLLPATQPISLLGGAMRFIYLFVIPALLIAGIPVEVFIKPDIGKFVMAYGIAAFWLVLSQFVLSVAIKRYESGNSIG